jgi:hypothetical protein
VQARFFFSNKSETAAEAQTEKPAAAESEPLTAADLQKLNEKIAQLEEKNTELLGELVEFFFCLCVCQENRC